MKNIKLFIIFASSLFACSENTSPPQLCFLMTLSDALPVQFWLNGQETFNQKEVDGVHHVCFCQTFECDDEINIQFTDTTIGSGTQAITLPALSTWLTRSTSGSLYDWTTGANPTVNLPGGAFPFNVSSEDLYVDYAFIPNREYVLTLGFTYTVNSGSSNPRTATISVFDSSYNTLFSNNLVASNGANSISITFTATSSCEKIGFKFGSGSDVDITVTSRSGTISIDVPYKLIVVDEDENIVRSIDCSYTALLSGGYLYRASFVPSQSTPDICDAKVQLQIRNGGNILASSDCVEILSDANETVLINYSNHRDFADINNLDVSPDPSYSLRIPATFFQERFPKESEVIELSNSRSIQLNAQIKAQRKLKIGPLPGYMRRKILLALSFQFVTIDDKDWVMQEAFEQVEGRDTWPLKQGSVWLTEKDYIKRNIL